MTKHTKNPAAVALGRLGGKSKSKAKLAAVRRNGRNGGLTIEQAKAAWVTRRNRQAFP